MTEPGAPDDSHCLCSEDAAPSKGVPFLMKQLTAVWLQAG